MSHACGSCSCCGESSAARGGGISGGGGAAAALLFDDVTGLPLVACPICKDIRVIALTCKTTKNFGKRFFKCPRNVKNEQYEAHLRSESLIGASPMVQDVVDQKGEEIEQLKFKMGEAEKEIAVMKEKVTRLEMKMKQPRDICSCVVVAVFVMLSIIWAAMK